MNSIPQHSLEELINQFKKIIAPENLIIDEESQKPFECDSLSLYCEIPMVTVLPESVAEYGFYYAPDPSSQIACSIGGNVAENAGGRRCCWVHYRCRYYSRWS